MDLSYFDKLQDDVPPADIAQAEELDKLLAVAKYVPLLEWVYDPSKGGPDDNGATHLGFITQALKKVPGLASAVSKDVNGVETFEPLPRFLKYVTVKLGEELPAEETNCSYAYIVTECNTEIEAKERYPEACIKGIERVPTRITTSTQVNADGNTVDISQFSNTYISDLPKAFAEMIKESGITVSRSTYSLVNSVIS